MPLPRGSRSSDRQVTRRTMLAGLGAVATLGCPAIAQAAPRIVVVGGGFAGATAAREVKRLVPAAMVTLIDPATAYTACPFSNAVVVGLREMSRQVFSFEGVTAAGIAHVAAHARAIDPVARAVRLDDGRTLSWDRLIVAPGIDLRFDALPGYDASAAERLPHAWKAGSQTVLLRRQLEAMEDGGLVVMSVPANPYRCPPGPYERASLVAHFLKTRKPRSKLLVLDAKDDFSKKRLFQEAWRALYPGYLEWVGLADGGKVVSVVPQEKVLVTDFARHKAAVANVIPPQRAGSLAIESGLAGATGWCAVDPTTFESRVMAGVHVIGDAAIAGAMPKSAFAANAQAKVCAQAVADALAGQPPGRIKLVNTCYSLAAPRYGISVAGVYEPVEGHLREVKGAGGTSPLGAPEDVRIREAAYADAWFDTVTREVYG